MSASFTANGKTLDGIAYEAQSRQTVVLERTDDRRLNRSRARLNAIYSTIDAAPWRVEGRSGNGSAF